MCLDPEVPVAVLLRLTHGGVTLAISVLSAAPRRHGCRVYHQAGLHKETLRNQSSVHPDKCVQPDRDAPACGGS